MSSSFLRRRTSSSSENRRVYRDLIAKIDASIALDASDTQDAISSPPHNRVIFDPPTLSLPLTPVATPSPVSQSQKKAKISWSLFSPMFNSYLGILESIYSELPEKYRTPLTRQFISLAIFLFAILSLYISCGLIYRIFSLAKGILWMIASVLNLGWHVVNCSVAPRACFWGVWEGGKGNVPQIPIPLIPVLQNEAIYEAWSKHSNSAMKDFFSPQTESQTDPTSEPPTLTDLILYTARISNALEIMSERNSLTLRDQSVAIIIPSLDSFHQKINLLQKEYHYYRGSWATELMRVVINSTSVAKEVEELEGKWEKILDGVVQSGDALAEPGPGSPLREKAPPSSSSFLRIGYGKKEYRTFESLARSTYSQIVMHRTSHIINLKSSARIATKKSEKILHMLENIGRQTKVLKMVGMVAEREKRDVKERANEEYEQQRRAVWNWLGWGAWTEVYTEEERVKRAAELKDLEILMADIINISELGKLTERVEQMVRKDMKMWNAVMVASEKFLGKLVMKGEVESGDKNDEAVDNGRIFGIEEDEETGEKRGKRWFGSGSKGKGDEEMATKERIKQEKIGKRIEELREWGKDVRAWVKIRVKFAYDLRKLIEG